MGQAQAGAGRGFGIAGGFEKGGYVATLRRSACAKPASVHAWCAWSKAFECGAIVNPDHLKNQVEGAMVHGARRRAV